MADAHEPPGEAAGDPVDELTADAAVDPTDADDDRPNAPSRRRSALRRLDRRTVALCAVVALLAALVASLAFVAIVGDDDDGTADAGQLSLTERADAEGGAAAGVDVDRLLGLRAYDAAGAKTTLDQVRGDGRALVNLWQSSCRSCVIEMPLLQAASEANPDVTFVGIRSIETDEAAADALLERTGVTYPNLEDPEGTLYAATGLGGLPANVLLAPDGRVLATKLGSFADAAELQAFLDDHPA